MFWDLEEGECDFRAVREGQRDAGRGQIEESGGGSQSSEEMQQGAVVVKVRALDPQLSPRRRGGARISWFVGFLEECASPRTALSRLGRDGFAEGTRRSVDVLQQLGLFILRVPVPKLKYFFSFHFLSNFHLHK